MEFVIIYFVIAVLLTILTKSMFYISFAVLSVFILIISAFELFFLVYLLKLVRAKPSKGDFLRIDDVKENNFIVEKNIKYKVAVYSSGGCEYESVFPAEGLFGKYFYRGDKNCRLLITRDNKVFDTYNIASCILWPIFCTIMLTGAVYLMIMLIGTR